MNSSIFNFKNNTAEMKKLASTQNLMFFFFFILYICFIARVIESGFLGFEKRIIGGMLVVLCMFQKRYRPAIIVVISFGVIFLTIGELYFRVSYFGMDGIKYFNKYVPANLGSPLSTLDYDDNVYTGLKINSRGIFKGGRFETNNLGFRDKNRYYKTYSDTIRIVVCGTSISMGSGVNQGENYSAYLEEMLNDGNRLKKFEVINLSIGGYRMSDMVDVLLKYGIKFNPDIVLIEDYGWNSNKLHPRKEYKGSKKQLFKMALKKPYDKLFFFNAIRNEYLLPNKRSINNVYRRLKNELIGNYRDAGGKKESQETKMKRYYLGKLKSITKEKKVYIISLREMRHLQRDAEEQVETRELCSEYGIAHIDTYKEYFGSNDREMIIYIGDRHPNAKAHRIYAHTILNAMKPDVEIGL